MDADNVQGNEIVAEEQQLEPMPSSEQAPTEEINTLDEEALALESSKNPERTKAYIEKLKAELAEAKSKSAPEPSSEAYGDSVFDTFRPQQGPQPVQPIVNASNFGALNQAQVDSVTQQFVNEDGDVDINGLNRALAEANRRAQEAERRAQANDERLTRFEETQQVREAHAVHPALDPSNKQGFDPVFFDLVRDRLLRNMYEGKNQSLLQVANQITSIYKPSSTVDVAKVTEQAKQEGFKEAQKVAESRKQGPIETGKGESRNSQADFEELRQGTRLGDTQAINERLKRAGI